MHPTPACGAGEGCTTCTHNKKYLTRTREQEKDKDNPPSEGQAPLATSGEEIENRPELEADEPAASPEPVLYPASEAPQAMTQTAEYLLLKTGREGLTEAEISALRELNASQYPAAVQKEIDVAVERFKRLGRDPATLAFDYIADSMRHRHTRPLSRAQPASGNPKGKRRAASEAPDAPRIVDGLLVGNWLDDA
jgi:hypothetical protein